MPHPALRPSFHARLIVCAWLLASCIALGQRAETPPDAALQALAMRSKLAPITPTVTVETGDLGGKAFGVAPDPAKTRRYYVAAEVDAWDFAPEAADPICGKPLPPQLAAQHAALKLRYFQYTDETFTARLLPTDRLGVMGPVLRGVVGETIAVTFLNKTQLPLSMHPHGVRYDKDSEGAYYQPNPGRGAAVGPGAKFTYIWQLDEASGPLPSEPSSKCWLYHSHVTGDAEVNLGLVGFIVVTDPARARPDGTPADVDREMAALFMIFNESGFSEEEEEALENAQAGDAEPGMKTWADLQQELELNSRFAINGQVFGNLKGLEMNEGERVRWYLFGLGSETDLHTAHWHGQRVIEEGRRRTDVVELLPATMKIADMVPDSPGSWLFHCHVAEHMQEGMFAKVVVHPKGSPGVSKAPEAAFFGMQKLERSLRIDRVESTVDFAAGKLDAGALSFRATATVPDAFSVFTTPVTVKLGGRSVKLQPAMNGVAKGDDVTFTISNSGRFGVVYGGTMEFRVDLRGAWLNEAKRLMGAAGDPIPVEITIGAARHEGRLAIPNAKGAPSEKK
jgi:FtsP/CotA-like multicopper oxidase with cupredoxin domain